ERRETATGVDHQGRQQPRPPAGRRSSLAGTPATEDRLRARAPATRPRRRRARARLALPAAPLHALAAHGRTRQTPPEDRRRLRTRARRLHPGDRDRAATQDTLTEPAPRPRAADASTHTENPRHLYPAPAPAGDPRP